MRRCCEWWCLHARIGGSQVPGPSSTQVEAPCFPTHSAIWLLGQGGDAVVLPPAQREHVKNFRLCTILAVFPFEMLKIYGNVLVIEG